LILAAVAGAALVILGAAILGWWLPAALASPGVQFEPCSVKTCEKVHGSVSEALGVAGPIVIQSDSVGGVAGVPGCAQCARVQSRGANGQGSSVYVIGSPRDVACKLFGGDMCKAN